MSRALELTTSLPTAGLALRLLRAGRRGTADSTLPNQAAVERLLRSGECRLA
ncbi:MAG: hypothetical protein ACK53V_18040 [Planctomycetota bacterium]